MNREEILEKYRNEHEDEGDLAIAGIQGRIFEHIILWLGIFFVGFHYFMNLTPPFEVFTLVCAYLAANAYPKYKFTKKKKYLVETIIEGTAAIFFFILFTFF